MKKENIQKLLTEARSEFARSIFELKEAGENIREKGKAAARDPLGVVSDALSTRLSSAQRWKLLGVALLAGGVAGYSGARKKHEFAQPGNGNGTGSAGYSSAILASSSAGWVRKIIDSVGEELAAEARVFGHRTLQNMLRAATEGNKRTDS